jgi:membrane protein DedA with SNARE-associated domain/membrane-associated phospholipid phosphatase
MLDQLTNLVGRLGHWGYLVIFLAVTLESSAFLGFLVPGETFVLFGGFLAAQGKLDWGDLMVLVCIGAILGDSIGYEVGRYVGREQLLRFSLFGLRQKHLEQVEEFFYRHGGKAVFFGRFTALLRALIPFVAGSSGMRYPRFLLYNAAGGVVWGVGFVLLGYFVGASWQVAERWIGRASAIVGGIVLLVFALVWLWRWLVRHETDVKQRGQALLAHPRIVALRRRLAPQLEFLRDRLSPQGYLALHLTAGTLVLIGATWLFGGIAEDILHGDPLTIVDKQVAIWFHDHTTPPLNRAMMVITSLASTPIISGITVLTFLLLLWWRCWYRLLALFLTVPGGMLLNVLLKSAFARQRPRFENPLVTLTSYSFPSGHTMAATLLYGALAVIVVLAIRSWRWRVLVVLVTWLVILLVGFSRIYLGAHYLSDVLGGMAAGLAWLALCFTSVDTLRRRRGVESSKSKK